MIESEPIVALSPEERAIVVAELSDFLASEPALLEKCRAWAAEKTRALRAGSTETL